MKKKTNRSTGKIESVYQVVGAFYTLLVLIIFLVLVELGFNETKWYLQIAIVIPLGVFLASGYFVIQWFELRHERRIFLSQSSATDYSRKIELLLLKLTNVSNEFNSVLNELTTAINQRETSIRNLDAKLKELSNEESELNKKVDALKSVPLPAIEYLLQESQKSDKRSASRDYFLFILGAILSTIISIVLKYVFHI